MHRSLVLEEIVQNRVIEALGRSAEHARVDGETRATSAGND